MQDTITEIAAVAEESSASTEELSASTEETSASTEQNRRLGGRAVRTRRARSRKLVSKFRVAD